MVQQDEVSYLVHDLQFQNLPVFKRLILDQVAQVDQRCDKDNCYLHLEGILSENDDEGKEHSPDNEPEWVEKCDFAAFFVL